MSILLSQLAFSIREIFDVNAGFESGGPETACRIQMPNGMPTLWVESAEPTLIGSIERYVIRETEVLTRLDAIETRLEDVQVKTRALLPGDDSLESSLTDWSPKTVEMSMLEPFPGWALLIADQVEQRESISDANIQAVMTILDQFPGRTTPVRSGTLHGVRFGDCTLIVQAEHALDPLDRELLALQAHSIHRLHVEQLHLAHVEELRHEAESAARTKTRFLGHMSHELRTPLNGVVGAVELLSDTGLSEEQQEIVEVQLQSAKWLREVIDAVIDLSKLESGVMEVDRIPFAPRELVDTVANGLRPLVDAKGLLFDIEFEPGVPQSVMGDPARIRQALLNLISNAIKFTSDGGIRINVGMQGTMVRFDVEDDGIGISAEEAACVFELFDPSDKPVTRQFGGSGLGLALVREFARLHGGDANADGRPGWGSKFSVTANLPATDVSKPKDSPDVDIAVPEARTLRVLVVEDQAVNRLILTRMLEKRGHTVEACFNGADAVKLITEDPEFDLIMMDHMMPVMTGPEATRAIRAMGTLTEGLKIVSATAAVAPKDIEAYCEAGYDDVMAKPISRFELVRILRETASQVSEQLAAQ